MLKLKSVDDVMVLSSSRYTNIPETSDSEIILIFFSMQDETRLIMFFYCSIRWNSYYLKVIYLHVKTNEINVTWKEMLHVNEYILYRNMWSAETPTNKDFLDQQKQLKTNHKTVSCTFTMIEYRLCFKLVNMIYLPICYISTFV